MPTAGECDSRGPLLESNERVGDGAEGFGVLSAHRLVEELREGETETTPLIAIGGLALWLGVLVAIVIVLVFLIARLAS